MSSETRVRLVLDQGIPRDTAALLREAGHDCTHVSEIGMSRADDGDIVRSALEQRAVVVTLDADFHAILAVTRASAPSVIRVRIQGLDGLAVTKVVQQIVAEFAVVLFQGSVITVKPQKTTCHRLPIGGAD